MELRQEHVGKGQDSARATELTDDTNHSPLDKESGQLRICLTDAGLLVLGLSWLVRQIFAR